MEQTDWGLLKLSTFFLFFLFFSFCLLSKGLNSWLYCCLTWENMMLNVISAKE